jgi:hypothetical protein
MTNVHFVSALVFNPSDPIEPAKRLEWLRVLLSAHLPLTLFVDDLFKKAVEGAPWFSSADHPELELVEWSLHDSETGRRCCNSAVQLALPEIRNGGKDGEFFMMLMNAKVELVGAVARARTDKPFVAFLDAGIVKIFKDVEGSLGRLKGLRMREDFTGVAVPGCWSVGSVSPEELARKICWMFCGGFFVVRREEAANLFEAATAALDHFLGKGQITWEVNVWVHMLTVPGAPQMKWFAADHNDRMTMIPGEWREFEMKPPGCDDPNPESNTA